MIVRVVLAVTCSAAAYTLSQLRFNHARVQPLPKLVREGVAGEDGFNKEIHTYPAALPDSKIQESLAEEKEEEEEEVKRVSSCSPNMSFEEDDQILLLPDLDDLLSHGIDIDLDETTNERGRSFPKRKLRTIKTSSRSDFYSYEDKAKGDGDEEEDEDDEEAMEIIEAFASQVSSPVGKCSKTPGADFGEILELRMIVAELKEKEKKMEVENYASRACEEESRRESEKQLKKKNAEIEKLNGIINVLEKEVDEKEGLKKDLESARAKFRELQRQMQAEAGNTKANLLMLKQQVAGLQTKEMESGKLDMETEKKLQFLKELEVEVVELRRTSKEVQHEKRELTVKLSAADARIAELSKITEGELVAEAEAEAAALRHANQDLCKQVEGLQMNRFSEVEELVYLRWVNACLRYELRNSKAATAASAEASSGALELGNSLSPRSQERAKQLLLEYAGPDLLRRTNSNSSHRDYPDTDGDDGISSLPTTPSEHGDYDDYSIDNRQSSKKKSGIIRKLKKWGSKAKDTTSTTPPYSSPSSSFSGIRGSPGRVIYHHGQPATKSPLESLLLRNTSEEVSITSYGMNNNHTLEESTSANNTMPESNVATSFQLMSKSVVGELDEKYPAFKDRHKLALAREKSIKEKAEQARVEKIAANKPKFTIPVEKLVQPENPPKTVGKLSDRGVRFEKLPEKDVSGGGVSTRAEKAEISKFKPAEMEKRAPRVPGLPPKPSLRGPQTAAVGPAVGGPPPPPPPPPPRALGGTAGPPPPPPPPGSLGKGGGAGKVQRAPQLVEFYQSLMRRETRSASASTGPADGNISDAHNNLVGEIENRSSFLLAVKADVETQGDFVMSLATEVRAAAYTDIEDVVAFVNWLDEELSFLVDERAVLKHFDWPESKADALREASFEYQDLKKLEMEVTRFEDDRRIPCDRALKKMLSLLEKVEQSVHALLRTRDMTIARHKEFAIPTYWLLDSGVVGKIKLSSVQLAQKYMKRVATELDTLHGDGPEKEPLREYLLLQGVRFAFRVHQFAGGFDAESMSVFESLRNQVQAHTTKDQSPMVENQVS